MDIGAELRTAREAKGLSIRTLAERTRVQPRTLAAIELNNLAAIPPRPFGRGFVRAFAQEVDLDPERTVHSYFSQFPASPPAAPAATRPLDSADAFVGRPSPWAGLGTAAAILIVVVTMAIVIGRRTETRPESNAVGTTGVTSPAASAPAPDAARPAAQPGPPSTPAAGEPLRLAFTVSRQCWIAATADGQRVLYRIVEPGERQTIEARQEIAIRFGDAEAVSWTLNGRAGGPLGTAGAVRDLRITPSTAQSLVQ